MHQIAHGVNVSKDLKLFGREIRMDPANINYIPAKFDYLNFEVRKFRPSLHTLTLPFSKILCDHGTWTDGQTTCNLIRSGTSCIRYTTVRRSLHRAVKRTILIEADFIHLGYSLSIVKLNGVYIGVVRRNVDNKWYIAELLVNDCGILNLNIFGNVVVVSQGGYDLLWSKSSPYYTLLTLHAA